MIRILVVDDHEFVREGIVAALQSAGDFDVVGSCEDGQQAFEQAEKSRPDIVLMDLSMPRLDGVQATRKILSRFPATRDRHPHRDGEPAAGERREGGGGC